MNPTIGDCKQYLPPSEKRGGLPFNHQAATDALLSQIWHQINCHVTCLIFNKGDCSLPLRNKQVFKTQIQCTRGADKRVSWYSDQAALEHLSVRQRGALQHTQRFSGAGNFDLLMHPIQSQRAKTQPDWCSPTETRAKLLGPARYTASFFPALLSCSST